MSLILIAMLKSSMSDCFYDFPLDKTWQAKPAAKVTIVTEEYRFGGSPIIVFVFVRHRL